MKNKQINILKKEKRMERSNVILNIYIKTRPGRINFIIWVQSSSKSGEDSRAGFSFQTRCYYINKNIKTSNTKLNTCQ